MPLKKKIRENQGVQFTLGGKKLNEWTSLRAEAKQSQQFTDEIATSAKRRPPRNDTFETQFTYKDKDEVHPESSCVRFPAFEKLELCY